MVFGMHHQLGGSTEDDMNKMSVFGHFFLKIMIIQNKQNESETKHPLRPLLP
jgi:hypothetical protein